MSPFTAKSFIATGAVANLLGPICEYRFQLNSTQLYLLRHCKFRVQTIGRV